MNNWKPKFKHYPHFDRYLPENEILKIVTDPVAVAKNPFFPFLLYYEEKTLFGRKKGKPRPIRYACRRDSYIFSYYRYKLSKPYEKKLAELGLSDCILAYRKIPVEVGKDSGKCNIHFAKDAFLEIRERGDCYAIVLDISSYFEFIEHDKLEKKWCKIIGENTLPIDHAKVFKAITNYAEVDYDQTMDRLGYKGERLIKSIKKYGFLQSKKDMPKQLCSPQIFREKICGNSSNYSSLIKKNKEPFGIPQGSPISDILANLYLIDFDKDINDYTKSIGGYYRRYSDDILIICPKNEKLLQLLLERVRDSIKKAGQHLVIKDKKTIVKVFTKNEETQTCQSYVHKSIPHQKNKPFEYLGFSYDGKTVKLKDSTLSRYYRKMTLGIGAEAKSLVDRYPDKTPEDIIKLVNVSHIYKKYGKVDGFEVKQGNYKNWTFWTYIKRADTIFSSDFDNIIMKQLKGHKKKVKWLLKEKLMQAYTKKQKKYKII